MKIRLPSTRKGRILLSVGALVGTVSVVGGISDASQSDTDRQYKVCMEAYHDAKHCYEDVYNHRTPTTPVPPSPTSVPLPAGHFHFCETCPLDVTQVVDLR